MLLAAMWLSGSQCAVAGCGDLLCATVFGYGWQLGAPSTHRLVGGKCAMRYSVLRHIAAHCNIIRQWKRYLKKKERGDRKEAAPCGQLSKGVAKWYRKLPCVAVVGAAGSSML